MISNTKLAESLKRSPVFYGALLFSGILTGLTVVFPQIGIFEWVALIPGALCFIFAALDEKRSFKKMYGIGFLFYMSYFLVNYSWFFSMYPLDFTEFNRLEAAGVVLIAWIGLSLLATLVYAFIPVLLRLLAKGRLGKKYPILLPIALAMLWTVAEWSLTLHWTGVPWGRLNLGQTGMIVFAQTASLFGSYFVTFVIVLVNALISYALINVGVRKLCIISSSAIFALELLSGVIVLSVTERSMAEDEKIKFAAVQGNVSSKEKWDNSYGITVSIERHEKYTELAAKYGADYVVWPETAIPCSLSGTSSVKRRLSEIANKYETTIFIGAQLEEPNENGEELFYNAVVMIDEDGNFSDTVYKKQHLVPFGEYVPMRDIITKMIPILSRISLLSYDITAGDESTVFETEDGVVGTLICFDSIYESAALESVRNGAEILILPTNDSWFDDSRAGNMHLSQAQMRAIENGRYLVRAANTGISAIVSPTGEIMDSQDLLTEGLVIEEVAMRDQRTLYSYIGNTFVYLIVTLILMWIAFDIGYSAIQASKSKRGRNNDTCD